MADKTVPKQLAPYAWQPGQSANPAGRPKGARSKLSESFLDDVLTEWETHGAVAIKDMRDKSPGDFCKMVASLLPKDVNLNFSGEVELSDVELIDRLRQLNARLAPFLGERGGNADERTIEATVTKKPAQLH